MFKLNFLNSLKTPKFLLFIVHQHIISTLHQQCQIVRLMRLCEMPSVMEDVIQAIGVSNLAVIQIKNLTINSEIRSFSTPNIQ